jgi:hypothetical protein
VLLDQWGFPWVVINPESNFFFLLPKIGFLFYFLLVFLNAFFLYIMFAPSEVEWYIKFIVFAMHCNLLKFLYNMNTRDPGLAVFAKYRAPADLDYATKK